MREIHGTAGIQVGGDATAIFDLITDVERLTDWNAAIEKVLATPRALDPGVTWTVQMHPAGPARWKSISTLIALDRANQVFSYRTVNADGNPSFTVWNWAVTPNGAVTDVRVAWDVFLRTWDRRLLAGPIRRRQLRREVEASLHELAQIATTNPARL